MPLSAQPLSQALLTLAAVEVHPVNRVDHPLDQGLLALGLAAVLSLVLVPLGIKLAWRLGVVDRPRGDKIHTRPTPLMGGVAMALTFLAVSAAWLTWRGDWSPQVVGLLLGCALATVLGVADEVYSLPPRRHFLGQIVVVAVALLAQFPFVQKVSNPFSGSAEAAIAHSGSVPLSYLVGLGSDQHGLAALATVVLGVAFTAFWIVGFMNTVNFLDGLDGLAGGVGAIAALFLGLWAVVMTGNGFAPTQDNQNVVLPLILCGSILGFLVFNWAPARVFMGDSGAMFIGFALGALSIFGPVKLGTALLIVIVPIVDVAWAIVRRLLGRRSFASGDKHHIYHRMLELGLTRRAVVLSFYALCIALGLIDLKLYKREKLIAFIIVAVMTGLAAVTIELRGRRIEALATRAAKRPDAPLPPLDA